MKDELKVTLDEQMVVMSENILTYSTDEEMRQLRNILACIGKRYREGILPSLAIDSDDKNEKKLPDKQSLT